MISIITAVHNQLAMNRIFIEYIKANTFNKYEIIIIDNASTDGSKEFFEKEEHVKVISNKYNYSYPYSQNQGIKLASGNIYCFLNNDIIVPKNWDKIIIECMDNNGLEVATSCGIEDVGDEIKRKKMKRKWNKIKNIIMYLFGQNNFSLRLMHRVMYKNWDAFSKKRQLDFDNQIIEGVVGNTVVIKKAAIDKIGLWDERIQAADHDLFMRVKKRSDEFGDIRTVHIVLSVFVHHYIKLTAKTKYPPFKDINNLISFEDKWGEEVFKVTRNSHQSHQN